MEIARHWRLKAQRYRLEGLTCIICGHSIFPPGLPSLLLLDKWRKLQEGADRNTDFNQFE